ncbi:MAG: di-heme oxidoredictase family protein [Alphaproteobacteria bacterium]
MLRRIQITIGFVACLLIAGGLALAESDATAPGGATTRKAIDENAFAAPAANLTADQQPRFFAGQRLFNTSWVAAPSGLSLFDGLGPVFNRVRCSGCHENDGRGQPPAMFGEPMLSMVVRLSVPGLLPSGAPMPHPAYGDQLNDRSIPNIPPEGRAAIRWIETQGKYADGTVYKLRRPATEFVDLAFGPIGSEVMLSERVAPQLIGMGLLEAVPEADILSRADPDDRNKDGIKGVPNSVWDGAQNKAVLGRFGWKANVPNLRQQIAAAFHNDMGLTTTLFAEQNCPEPQLACRAAPNGGTPEINDEFLDDLTFYISQLAVPARRDVDKPAVKAGELVFARLGCAPCHVPTLTTGPHALPTVANQTIRPYTDLLLHDMGEGLADGRPDFEATGRQWRTAPLWGLGLVPTVNGHSFLLHDGRARDFAEAILWHGGEADRAKEAFRKSPAADRAALIEFLKSL